MLVTDIYIENLGGGFCQLEVSEQTGPNSFELRYAFTVQDGETKLLSFTVGLPLGGQGGIEGVVLFGISSGSRASASVRANGLLVP